MYYLSLYLPFLLINVCYYSNACLMNKLVLKDFLKYCTFGRLTLNICWTGIPLKRKSTGVMSFLLASNRDQAWPAYSTINQNSRFQMSVQVLSQQIWKSASVLRFERWVHHALRYLTAQHQLLFMTLFCPWMARGVGVSSTRGFSP